MGKLPVSHQTSHSTSHGSWNMWVGSEAGELENQIDYIFYLLCSVKIVSFIYVVCLVYYRG
jgi:hypothetical protein